MSSYCHAFAALEGAPEDGARLWKYVQAHAQGADHAADIYQESLVRVLERGRATVIRNPLAYALRVARNLIYASTTDAHEPLEDMSCSCSDPERALLAEQALRQIERVLEQMPDLRKQVFVMRRIQGMSRDEIALSLGLKEAAVAKHITRATTDIQRYLD